MITDQVLLNQFLQADQTDNSTDMALLWQAIELCGDYNRFITEQDGRLIQPLNLIMAHPQAIDQYLELRSRFDYGTKPNDHRNQYSSILPFDLLEYRCWVAELRQLSPADQFFFRRGTQRLTVMQRNEQVIITYRHEQVPTGLAAGRYPTTLLREYSLVRQTYRAVATILTEETADSGDNIRHVSTYRERYDQADGWSNAPLYMSVSRNATIQGMELCNWNREDSITSEPLQLERYDCSQPDYSKGYRITERRLSHYLYLYHDRVVYHAVDGRVIYKLSLDWNDRLLIDIWERTIQYLIRRLGLLM